MVDVFVSYKKEEHPMAERVIALLQAAGYSVWWDQDLTPRTSWDAGIEREIAAAKAVLVLWTPKSVDEKSFVRKEAAYAQDHGKLVPAMLIACDLPLRFRDTQTANLVGWDQRDSAHPEWQRVVEWIASIAGIKQARASGAHQRRETELTAKPIGQVAHLQVERVAQISAGGSSFHIYWNNERLGEIRMGNSSAFDLPVGSGQFQIGMYHALKRTLHLTAPLNLSLREGEVTRVKIKVGSNLWGFPPLLFWVNDETTQQTRGWVENK